MNHKKYLTEEERKAAILKSRRKWYNNKKLLETPEEARKRKDKHNTYFNNKKYRKYILKSAYGITIEDYNKMFEKQCGCCAICNIHQSELRRALCVDHNHKTGKIRGLLCDRCNQALGNIKENKEALQNMIKYLEEYK